MATPIQIKHPATGLTQQAYYGYSWTFLFFGFLVPLIRGETLKAALHFFLGMCSLCLFNIVYSFFYNKHYMTRKLLDGWVLADTPERNAMCEAELHMKNEKEVILG